ncbi:MAG: alanine dehydrogenase [Geoalkalibacter sp.]|uniref:alanine dehydrogenase n=1 Tax=Geoalkalibacter sp. TaxID=3041440 RepID=UPI002A95523A|nr:alanine dehydrogenase [Thermodesulfobacteriota bacterium]
MVIGVPTEIKTREYRVALTPVGARALVEEGHEVRVQSGAGLGSGIDDQAYREVGAKIVDEAADIFAASELLVKVKEPLEKECALLRRGQILMTFLHLAPAPELTRALLDSGVTAVAYETIEPADGSLPLLRPMSEVAGRMAVQVGAHYLQKENGGRGVLLSGAPGVPAGKVLILGAGVVGSNAVRIAVGMGADVTVMDIDPGRMARLDDHYGNRVRTLMSSTHALEEEVPHCDLLIGAVLVPGARAPRLVGRDLVSRMISGSVVVDVAVDQGGCVETIHPTTHDQPVYRVGDVLHYGVANMPGAVSRTSTYALTNSTLPYVRALAARGLAAACQKDEALRRGVNIHAGRLCNRPVAEALNLEYKDYRP